MEGAERETITTAKRSNAKGHVTNYSKWERREEYDITAPATESAKQYDGWGTALKPAYEPICVARKPLIGTVVENVLEYGTGGINIDGCRVEVWENDKGGWRPSCYQKDYQYSDNGQFLAKIANGRIAKQHSNGRWPANFIHDGSEEVLQGFPSNENQSASRFFYCAKASKKDRDEGCEGMEKQKANVTGLDKGIDYRMENGVITGLKAGTKYAQNHHPTVKPTNLMQYLCRLVTPLNGTILDPFLGSGSTGKAAIYEGFKFIGFDLNSEYIDIAKARIEYAINSKEQSLFDHE
jgi:site-specific DNA-methyltransferase (adenine-specific)